MPSLQHIRIVLVEPAGPLNVGSVARVMKNFGLSQLVLVNPRCDRHHPDALQMAVHARDLLDNARIVDSIAAALAGTQRAVATTGENHHIPLPLEPPRQVLPWLLPHSPSPATPLNEPSSSAQPSPIPQQLSGQSAILFGREDHGLSGAELHHAQRLLRIPSDSAYSSLNLAQAVALCCYELSLIAAEMEDPRGDRPIPPTAGADPALDLAEPAADLAALEAYYQQLEALLLRIGYLHPHTALSRMKRFRRLHARAQPSQRELRMLRGILRQTNWALHNLSRTE